MGGLLNKLTFLSQAAGKFNWMVSIHRHQAQRALTLNTAPLLARVPSTRSSSDSPLRRSAHIKSALWIMVDAAYYFSMRSHCVLRVAVVLSPICRFAVFVVSYALSCTAYISFESCHAYCRGKDHCFRKRRRSCAIQHVW